MMPAGAPPLDFDDLEFETIEENWNEYELSNHTKVRGKLAVTRFSRDRHNPDPNAINIGGQNLFVVTAPVEQRGNPTPLTPDEIANPNGTPVQVLTSNERWNKYRIIQNGMVLKVKLILHDVVRVQGRYDNDGMPAYVLNSAPMVVPDRNANTNIRT